MLSATLCDTSDSRASAWSPSRVRALFGVLLRYCLGAKCTYNRPSDYGTILKGTTCRDTKTMKYIRSMVN